MRHQSKIIQKGNNISSIWQYSGHNAAVVWLEHENNYLESVRAIETK